MGIIAVKFLTTLSHLFVGSTCKIQLVDVNLPCTCIYCAVLSNSLQKFTLNIVLLGI